MRTEELINEYLTDLKTRTKVMKSYRERMRLFSKFLKAEGIGQAHEITVQTIEKYHQFLENKLLSVNSQYVYLSELKRFLYFLFNRDYLLFDLSDGIVLPKWERKRKLIYAKAEIKAIIGKISEQEPVRTRNRAIVALLLYEQMKTGDISNLSVMDINLEAGEIRINRQKRFVPICGETAGYLRKYLKIRCIFKAKVDYLFVKKGGTRLDQQSITIALRETKRNG